MDFCICFQYIISKRNEAPIHFYQRVYPILISPMAEVARAPNQFRQYPQAKMAGAVSGFAIRSSLFLGSEKGPLLPQYLRRFMEVEDLRV